MSTLSGIASKGEKGKSKYQCLDINNLYRGESLEPSQQKSTVQRCKYGMQSLGKVPSARRPPANLPSLKSENSGSEPAVSLVPTGGAGWGNKPGENQSSTPTQPIVTTNPNSVQSNTTSQVQAVHSSATLPTQPATLPSGHDQPAASTTHTTTGDKSWSSIMAGEGGCHPPSFLAHQSPLFQQEFPKLSSGDGQNTAAGQKGGADTQYGPGPSLRPQTEGSWIQGGGRPQTGTTGSQAASLVQGPLPHQSGVEGAGGRNSLGPHPPPSVAMDPGGPGLGIPTNGPPLHVPPLHMPLGTSPQFRTMGTPFMYRGSFPAPPGAFPPSFQAGLGPPRQRFPGNYLSEGRFVGRPVDGEEIVTRPIIKEEELNHMDDIARDSSWARPDEIDYNEKIVFSDTEDSTQDDERQTRREEKDDRETKEPRESCENEKDRNRDDKDRSKDRDRDRRPEDRLDKRGTDAGSRSRQTPSYSRLNYPPPLRPQTSQRDRENEEEMWKEKRRIQIEMMAVVTERAKQRKEEEEKRHEETKKRLGKSQNSDLKDREDNTTIVPLPNWADKNRQVDSDRDRSRTSSEGMDDKMRHDDVRQQSAVSSLRSDRDNRSRPSVGSDDRNKRDFDDKDKLSLGHRQDKTRSDDRDRSARSCDGSQSYSRHFQNNLPPRFLRVQVERNQSSVSPSSNYLRSTGSPQPPSSAGGFDPHWSHSNNSFIGQSSVPPNSGSRGPPRRFNSESSESNTEKSRNDREGEDWEYERYKSSRERNYGKHSASYYDVDHSRRYGDRMERRDIDPERNSEDSWERENIRERERDRERDLISREKDRDRHADERMKSDLNYEEEREWRRSKERKSEDKEVSELEEREKDVCSKKEERKEERRLERPQRPDSRDSRASRESRNSRDSVRDEKHDADQKVSNFNRGFSSTFTDFKEDKRKTNEKDKKEILAKYVDEYPLSFPNKSRHRFNYQRHIPGPPITREKLEASEKNDTKRNLTQLKRFSDSKRPSEEKEVWESHGNKERNSSEFWTESASEQECQNSEMSKQTADDKNKISAAEKRESGKIGSELLKQETQEKAAKNEVKEERDSKTERQDEEKEKREKPSKNRGSRGRSESGRGRQGWSIAVFRSSHGSRGDRRRRDSGRMAGRSRLSNREWNPESESDGSGDEVSASTESGKEDKKSDTGRCVKSRSHFKKLEKEEKIKETKKSESGESKSSLQASTGLRFDRKGEFLGGSSREGFAPSGQPSRRGRGSVRMRGGISHRMDGYGPPPAKSPFSHNEDKKPSNEKSGEGAAEDKAGVDDEKGKQKQQSGPVLGSSSNRTVGSGGNKASHIPPRMQKKGDAEQRESTRKSSRGGRHHASKSTPDQGDDAWETTSENSDEDRKQDSRSSRKNYQRRAPYGRGEGPNSSVGGSRSVRGGPRSNSTSEKKLSGRESHGSKSSGPGAVMDRSSKGLPSNSNNNREDSKLSGGNPFGPNAGSEAQKAGNEEKGPESRPSDFDEGRNKKKESKNGSKLERRSGRERDKERRNKSSKDSSNHQQQQQAVITTSTSVPQPLMSQVVPAILSMSKNFERRANLPPRLAKQRQNNRIQKQQATESNDASKVNHSMNMFSIKEGGVGPPSVSAWEKPLLSTSPIKSAPMQMAATSSEPLQSDNSSQRSSPHVPRESVDKSLLDGSSPPVNTIIFENTNFKSTPNDIVLKNQFNSHMKQQRLEKGERKISEQAEDVLGFSTGKTDITAPNSGRDVKASEPAIIYGKSEDNADMKLDFQFETELSQLTDDKSTKGMRDLSRSIQQSNMSPSTADLNFKIASVKKVWETMQTVTEHNTEDSNVSTFSPNFSQESTMDPSAYSKTVDGSVVVADDGSEVVYNAVPPMQVNVSYTASKTDVSSTTSNVCKVKPQQQTVLSSGHSPIGHSGQSPLSHGGPISPPPYSTAQGGQFNYQQTSIGGTAAQFGGMSAIPSPPTVLYNSSTQLPPAYQAFQIDGAQVLSSQATRTQFSQFPYGLSQGIGQTSAYSQQSVYLHQTAPPTPAPDIYPSSLSQCRLQPAAGPFGQSQLNNNPNTVLISSTANSLMSATVKPSLQPIGAIGTKGATPFQQNPLPSLPSQHSQLFIPYDPVQLGVNQSYLPNSQIVQRGAPVQPSASSFYSSSAGAQAGFYQTPGSTLTQQGPAAPQMHQAAGYSLPGFSSQSSATVGLQSFGSQMGAQQYRTPGSVAPTTYLKSAVTHHHPTALNLAQKTSTSSQQDVLDSVFSSAPQIPSPKPRPSKQLSQQQQQQSQQSPTQQPNNKFGSYQTVTQSSQLATGAQRVSQSNINIQNVKSSGSSPRYPNPIQRPVSYQHNSRYRSQQPRPASSVKPYFGSQADGNLKLEESSDLKSEEAAQLNCDTKISDSAAHGKAENPEDDAPKD